MGGKFIAKVWPSRRRRPLLTGRYRNKKRRARKPAVFAFEPRYLGCYRELFTPAERQNSICLCSRWCTIALSNPMPGIERMRVTRP
jgi:hypothetical protein